MLTAEQLEQRRSYVGASDVSAICGENPYRNIIDVWTEKVYGTLPDDPGEAANLGNMLERACRDLAEQAIGVPMSSSNPFRVAKGTRLGVRLDAWCELDAVIPVECKTGGILYPWSDQMLEWGESGTDEVPAQYLLQVTAQMIAVDAPFGFVSALLGGRGHVMYRIERNEELVSMILDAVARFWACVESRTRPEAPEDVVPSIDILKRIRRVPKSVVSIADARARDAVIEWKRAVRDQSEAEKAVESAKARVVELLGEAEAGLVSWTGEDIEDLAEVLGIDDLTKAEKKVAVTYLEQSKRGVDLDMLKARFPEAYAACERVSTFRVLRLGNAKDGMIVNR